MSKQYCITITRFEEDEQHSELVDQYLSAEDTIDLMVYIQKNIAELDDEEEDSKVEEVSKLKKRPNLTKKQETSSDNPALADLVAGMKPKEVAEKYGLTLSGVYSLKHRNKHLFEETAYQASRAKFEDSPKPTEEEKIEAIVKEGVSFMELEMSFPSTPAAKLREIYDRHRSIEI